MCFVIHRVTVLVSYRYFRSQQRKNEMAEKRNILVPRRLVQNLVNEGQCLSLIRKTLIIHFQLPYKGIKRIFKICTDFSLSELIKERECYLSSFHSFCFCLCHTFSFYKQSSLCVFPKSSGVGAVSLENNSEMFHLVRDAQY